MHLFSNNARAPFFSVVLLFALLVPQLGVTGTGSWGDQGDGTYRNPILNADYPDVDVEQLGYTFYMISSKQHMSPGMVILESKDMVNWNSIGHVWDTLSWAPEYNWDRMAGYPFGVWAGDLAHHDGRWYCYQIDFKHGLYMSSASDIRGPWSKPHKLLPNEKVFDDPAVYWDDDAHEAYLLCNTARKLATRDRKTRGNENRIFKMSWDGRRILDEGVVIHTGPGAEAAKIYKINGTWYIFLAQWYRPDPRRPKDPAADKGDRKQLVLRSKTNSIYGPYESRVVFERGNGILRSCSQGGLMKAPDGSWWYTHQLIQNCRSPFQGRPQCLEPVEWVDGWPVIGEDVDGDGVGEPVRQHAKPIAGHPITAPATSDEFDSPERGTQWEWNHNPRDTHWSLNERSGWLRLKASVPVGNGDFWRACNTISQRIMGTTTGKAVAKFDLAGMQPGQRAGFVRFGGVYHLLGVHARDDGTRRLFFNANGSVEDGPVLKGDLLWIRTTNSGDQARFATSTDGRAFENFGPAFTLKFGKWTGDRLGFFCWNDEREAGHIDVDYFRYDYDGPKAGNETAGIGRFIFAYFNTGGKGQSQGLQLAWSRDGYEWRMITHPDGAFLKPEVGGKLMRDPSVVEGPDGMFHMVWTTDWWQKGIGVAHSRDLLHWSEQQYLDVMQDFPGYVNCWAPEISYDAGSKLYLIYWASTVPGKFPATEGKGETFTRQPVKGVKAAHRIYETTTQDFVSYTATKLLYNDGYNCIDAFIAHDSPRNRFAMVIKDEELLPKPKKNIRVAFAESPLGPWGKSSAPVSPDWVEGPALLRVGKEWFLYYDAYTRNHYEGLKTSDFETWTDITLRLKMPEGIRHGTPFGVSETVLKQLLEVGSAK